MAESSEFITLSSVDKKKGLFLPRHYSSDLAYLCGVFCGDGNITYRPAKHEYSLKCVGNPLDEKTFYYDVVSPKFTQVFGYEPQPRLHDSGTTFGFRIYSKALFQYLTGVIGLPSGPKYGKLHIPDSFGFHLPLVLSFIRGVADTDGCISFKKKYKSFPYYPVITIPSKDARFIKEISQILTQLGFRYYEVYDYKVKDHRIRSGYTLISKIELNGLDNLELWNKLIGFSSPKHLKKIEMFGKNSGG